MTLCLVGRIIDDLDDRQEAHIEAFVLAQRWRLAADMMERHTGTEVRWTDVRRHIYKQCTCWKHQTRLELRPSTRPPTGSPKKYDEDLEMQAREIWTILLSNSDKGKKAIDGAVKELSASRFTHWGKPLGFFKGGRQWACETASLEHHRWKPLYDWLKQNEMMTQVGRGHGIGFLLYEGVFPEPA